LRRAFVEEHEIEVRPLDLPRHRAGMIVMLEKNKNGCDCRPSGVTNCTLYFFHEADAVHLRDHAEPVEREPAKGA